MPLFTSETFRLIRKTIRRFMSLVLIVFIGSGFMMGLLSAPDVMRLSTDRYYDEKKLQDLTIYSPYGFCNEDYVALQKADNAQNVYASKEIDLYSECEGHDRYVIRVSELSRKLDGFRLVEGRLPQHKDECLALYGAYMTSHYDIGDVLQLDYGSNNIEEFLNNDRFKVVGIFMMPSYLGKMLGPSNFNNEELDSLILVPNSCFVSEYYTTMYLNLEGADKYISGSKGYDDFIKINRIGIENLASEQQSYLRDRIVEDGLKQLEENEALFEQMKQAGQKQLDEAKKQLDEAGLQLKVYETQLSTLTSVIASLEATIRNDASIYQSIYNTTVEIEQDISSILNFVGLPGINAASSAMEYTFAEYHKAIAEFNSISSMLASGKVQYEEGLKQYEEGKVQFEEEIAEGEQQLKFARRKLEQLPSSKWQILDRDKLYSLFMYKNNANQIFTIGVYFPIMFYLVAALVCITTMKRLIDEQRGQIGIYTALGYSNSQIIFKYTSYALLASLCGGIPGIIFGLFLFPSVIYNAFRMLYYLPELILTFPFVYALITLSVFTLLISLLTAYLVNNVIKDVPATLMRPKTPRKIKEIFIEKISFLWNSLSFTSKTTARNIFRYKSRFFMTIAGVAGCCSLLLLGFSVIDCVGGVVETQYEKIIRYNYQIYLDSDEHIDENVKLLLNDPKIDEAVSYMSYTTKLYFNDYDNTATLIAIDPKDAGKIFGLYKTDMKTPIRFSSNGIIISEKLAKNGHITVGDYITVESIDGIKAEVQVADICEMYMGHYLFMSKSLYENIFDMECADNYIGAAAADQSHLLSLCSRMPDYVSVSDFSAFIDSFSDMIKALNIVIVVIILVAGSLAFVVLFNLTQVNISERIREIATLKVLGFNDHEVNMYIFKEILLLSFIGSLLGLPLGVIENRLIMNLMDLEMMMFGKVIKTVSYFYALGITMLFTVIVLLFMRKPLQKVNMVESLKSVE